MNDRRSAAHRAADALREEIMSGDMSGVEGERFLGSEQELLGLLGVSQPTLRQAVRMLEHEQLITVRRGVGGGLFSRRPTEQGVTQTASVFLRAQGTTYGDLNDTVSTMVTECARLAALNPDAAQRERPLRFYDEHLPDGLDEHVTGAEFVVLAGRFDILLAELTGNPTLELFVTMLMDLAQPAAGARLFSFDRMGECVAAHTSVARAVAEGRSDVAARRMRAYLARIRSWADEGTTMEALYPH
jgi:GntR family transcriptional regulator, transcriptional repressor for pyruvate dehydrogenase complex